MASVAERKEGKRVIGYKVRWTNPDGTARARSFKVVSGEAGVAKDAARAFLSRVQAAEDEGVTYEETLPKAAPDLPTVKEAAALFLLHVRRGRSDGTVANYAKIIGSFVCYLGETSPITGLRQDTFLSWFDAVSKTVRQNTARNRAQAVRALWSHTQGNVEYRKLVRAHGLDAWDTFSQPIPALAEMNIAKGATADVRAATWAECDAMISQVRGVARKLAMVARYTGLRKTQILNLDWSMFDLEGATLRIPANHPGSKSRHERKGRTMPISRHLVAEMAAWGVRTGPVVLGNAGKRASAGAVDAGLVKAWERSGVSVSVWRHPERGCGCPAHGFRHAFTSELKSRKGDVEAAEYLVGHVATGSRGNYLDAASLPLESTVALVSKIGDEKAADNVKRFARG